MLYLYWIYLNCDFKYWEAEYPYLFLICSWHYSKKNLNNLNSRNTWFVLLLLLKQYNQNECWKIVTMISHILYANFSFWCFPFKVMNMILPVVSSQRNYVGKKIGSSHLPHRSHGKLKKIKHLYTSLHNFKFINLFLQSNHLRKALQFWHIQFC